MTIEYKLSKGQQRAIAALGNERQAIIDQANRTVAEITASLLEHADLYYPETAGKKRRFEQREGHIVMIVEEEAPEQAPEEAS